MITEDGVIINDQNDFSEQMQIGYTCKVCEKDIPITRYEFSVFPICPQCLRDLKELIATYINR